MSEETVVDSEPVVEAPEAAAPEVSTPEPQQPAEPNYWGAIRSLPEFQGQDERAVAHSLYSAMRREKAASEQLAHYRQVMPHAQEYLQNKSEYEAWLQSRNQPQQEPQPSPWWNPPEIKESYRRWIVRDQEGREQIHPDAPYEARNAIMERQQYTEDFARKFLENPQETLGPMVESLATQKANELIEQRIEQERREEFVRKVTEENRDWLFQEGTENPTQAGLQVHKFIEEGASKGIDDPHDRWDFAQTKIENVLAFRRIAQLEQLVQQLQQAPQQQPIPQQSPPPRTPEPAATQAQTNMDYLRREAARRPSRAAAPANAGTVTSGNRSFAEMLRDTASDRGLL